MEGGVQNFSNFTSLCEFTDVNLLFEFSFGLKPENTTWLNNLFVKLLAKSLQWVSSERCF